MAQRPAGAIYWINALIVEIGLPLRDELPKEKRRVIRALAKLLQTNEFDDVKQIEGLLMRPSCDQQCCVFFAGAQVL